MSNGILLRSTDTPDDDLLGAHATMTALTVFLICLVIFCVMIPGEVWKVLGYLALLGVVSIVGFGALIIWLEAL